MMSGLFVFGFISLMVIAMEITWSVKNKGRLK
jgi:hypothetical protein